VKEHSRELLWGHAVRALTLGRDSARLLRTEDFLQAWEYCDAELRRAGRQKLDTSHLIDWLAFANSRYGRRDAAALRVAYLCGPEPENDLRVLTRLGVRVENVWAIEENASAHEAALQQARQTYPALKIFHGSFDSFVRVVRDRFDVIYLDFTAPLTSSRGTPYSTLHTVFDEQVLAEFGVLVVNVAEPTQNEREEAFLADYFAKQPFVESDAMAYGEAGDTPWYAEIAPDDWTDRNELLNAIRERYGLFYSAFCTQYPSLYANRVQPTLRLLRVAHARRGIFTENTEVYGSAVSAATDVSALLRMVRGEEPAQRGDGFGPGMDMLLSSEKYPLWWFLQNVRDRAPGDSQARRWLAEYQKQLPGIEGSSYKPSRENAVQLNDLLWTLAEGYFPLAARPLMQSAFRSLRMLAGVDDSLFCDTPMLHLLTQLAVNQMGSPHHPVLGQHLRVTYTAKSTPMYLDVHVLDQCRPMYDALPGVSLYPEHFGQIERQMITRIGMSRIAGETHGVVPDLYWGSALADRYGDTHPWARPSAPSRRLNLEELR